MSSASKFSAYDRAAYLATVPAKQRALAEHPVRFVDEQLRQPQR